MLKKDIYTKITRKKGDVEIKLADWSSVAYVSKSKKCFAILEEVSHLLTKF